MTRPSSKSDLPEPAGKNRADGIRHCPADFGHCRRRGSQLGSNLDIHTPECQFRSLCIYGIFLVTNGAMTIVFNHSRTTAICAQFCPGPASWAGIAETAQSASERCADPTSSEAIFIGILRPTPIATRPNHTLLSRFKLYAKSTNAPRKIPEIPTSTPVPMPSQAPVSATLSPCTRW